MGNLPSELGEEDPAEYTLSRKAIKGQNKKINKTYNMQVQLPGAHVSSHQAILKVESANSFIYSTEAFDPLFSKRLQHNNYFLSPDLSSVCKDGKPPPLCDQSFYYVRPSRGVVVRDLERRHQKALYYVKKPSKAALRAARKQTGLVDDDGTPRGPDGELSDATGVGTGLGEKAALAKGLLSAADDEVSHQYDWDPLDPCILCDDAPNEPLQASCEHIACRECWMTWVEEMGGDGEQPLCPVCDEPVGLDTLEQVEACGFCDRPLITGIENWTPLCGHKGCLDCWLDLTDSKCPVCDAAVDTMILHQTYGTGGEDDILDML